MIGKKKSTMLGEGGEALGGQERIRPSGGGACAAADASSAVGLRSHKAFSVAAEVAALAMVPAVLAACALSGADRTALLSMVVAVASVALFFAGYEKGAPRLRDTMPVAVMAALAAAGRILFAPVPSMKPVSAIAIIAGAAFGRRAGFMTGALAALVSNFFFGQGPWTPWEMYGWGLVGYLGGVLAAAGAFGSVQKESASAAGLAALAMWGVASGYLYGLILNMWSIIGFFHPQDLAQALMVYAAALPFDTVHGAATAVFLLALYRPWMRKLQRVKRKYDLGA